MFQRISDRLRDLPPEWKFHFVLGVGLLLYLALTVRVDFSDPLIVDEVKTWKPGSSIGVLRGSWETEGDTAVAGQSGASFVLQSSGGPWRTVRVMLNGNAKVFWRVRLERDFSSSTIMNVRPGKEIVLSPEDFRLLGTSDSPVEVQVAPMKPSEKGAALSRVSVRFSAYGTADDPLPLPAILYAPLFPLALSLFLTRSGRRSARHATIIGGAFGVIMAGCWTFEPRLLNLMWLGAMGLFFATSSASLLRGLAQRRGGEPGAAGQFRMAELTCAAALAGLALWTRWEALLDVRTMAPLPDAAGYLEIARRGTFFETLQTAPPFIREPLFPALIRFWYLFTPESATSARFLTMLVGFAAVAMTWVAGRRLFTPMIGCLAAALMAVSPFLAQLSVSVLRDDLATVLFLGLICVPAYLGSRIWIRSVAFGILGGALGLLRLVNIVLLVPFTAIEGLRRRWSIPEMLLVFALAVPVLLPHLAFNFRESRGDILFSSNVHTRYYYNLQHIGESGFPATMEEWRENPYAGEVVPTSTLFEGRNPISAAWQIALGYIDIFVWRFPHGHLFFGREVLMLFGVAGLWVWWKRKRELWWLAVWNILFLFPVAVIAEIHLDYRLASPAAPVILWTWAAGVELAAIALWREILRRFPRRVDQNNILT